MPDYQTMTAYEALRFAKEALGLTCETIATRMGVRVCIVRRYMRAGDDAYLPSLERIPAFYEAVGNAIILQWLEA